MVLQVGCEMADKARLKRLKRIVDLQNRIKQSHEWKLNDLQNQQIRLSEERVVLSKTLEKPGSSSDRLLELIGHQLKRASLQERQIEVEKNHHQEQRAEHQKKMRFMEKVHHAAVGAYQREMSGKELQEIVDIALLGKNKSI